MSFFARQRYKPGVKGYSPRPLTPEEARVIQNLDMERDGTWRARPGLLTRVTHSSTIRNLSNRPYVTSGGRFVLTDAAGTLRLYDANAHTISASLGSGWPTAGRLKTAFSGSNEDPYWAAARTYQGSGIAGVYTINPAGTLAAVAAAPNLGGVESYGLYLMGWSGTRIHWCDGGDVTAWMATNEIGAPWMVGTINQMMALSESQILILGSEGTGILTGNEATIFTQGEFLALHFAAENVPAVKCGRQAVVWGQGSKLFLVDGTTADRFDFPVQDDLEAFGDIRNVSAWFDPTINCYCVSHSDAGKTLLFDLERRAWVGTWDKALVGIGHWEATDHPRRVSYLGYGAKIVQVDYTGFTDDGSAYTCALETVLPSVSAPESEKACSQLHIDGVGTWTVKLYGRSNPDASFTLLDTRVCTAPGWVYFAAHTYREGLVRFEATAASTIRFRSFQADERAVGVA